MILKNITSSDKELTDNLSGKRILVEAGKTIDLDRASFNKNAFKVIEEVKFEKKKTKVEEISTEEEINIEKEVI